MSKTRRSQNRTVFLARIFLLSFFALTSWHEASAKEINLGQFSARDAEKIFFQPISVEINGRQYPAEPEEIKKWLAEKEMLVLEKDYRSEIENTNFCAYQKSAACRLVFSARQSRSIRKKSEFFLEASAIEKFLDDLSRQTDRDPVDAKFAIEDGRATSFALSQKGLQLDKEKSLKIIADYFSQDKDGEKNILVLAFSEIEPSIASDSLDNLGINSLIGEGHSNFKGSPKNRIFNIKVATSRFNGVLIKPEEEFSFVKVLGEVDGEHGYLPELVIKHDKTEPEFGGGICQVSTTAFRAAILSGLKITARKNHAYPVQYYNPQGFDSTVYVPRPDLRFVNNTPGHILIQTKIEGTELVFQFYGTSDGRRVNMIGPKIIQKNPDGSMKTTFTQEVYDKNDSLLSSDVFNSNYASPSKYPHPGQVLNAKPADWSDKEWRQYKKEHNI
jgi:vancomycin resistance protein YoaR